MELGSSENNPLRIVKILGMVFFAYAIILLLVALIIPITDAPQTIAPTVLSLVMMALMPVEILLVYAFYRALGNKTKPGNITGLAVLMYIVGVNPAIYALIIGFTDSFSRYFGVIMGLAFSLGGLLFAWILLSRLLENMKHP